MSWHLVPTRTAADLQQGATPIAQTVCYKVTDIICIHKGGRDSRRSLANLGQAPREFFYGITELQAAGYDISELNGAEPYQGAASSWRRAVELANSHLTGLGLRPHWVASKLRKIADAKVVLAFTDGMSLTLGEYFSETRVGVPFLAGCFHGLSDLEYRCPKVFRKHAAKTIRRALQRLDLVAFLGPADRDFAIDRYGLDPARCYHYCFGVDERFWSPNEHPTEEGRQFVSVGSDPNRDYKTLLAAPTDIDIVILTRLPIEVPTGRSITVLKGSFWEGDVSDQQVRELYRKSMGVVVPLNDVYQPTGQSVTIQAMACGKPVVLTRNKGLWAPSLLRHQENCILVPPSDPIALADALKRLEEDPQLRKALGENARKTVLAHWGLQATVHSTRQIVDQGLATTFRKQ